MDISPFPPRNIVPLRLFPIIQNVGILGILYFQSFWVSPSSGAPTFSRSNQAQSYKVQVLKATTTKRKDTGEFGQS